MKFFFPNTEQLAKGTAVQLAIRFGMQTAEPLKINEKIGSQGNPTLSELKGLEGRPWLTSLALKFGGKEFVFEECIITINQEKNIVTTPLQGRNGTIKEYVSDGDYQITVDAGISSNDLDYPLEEATSLLQDFLALPETLEVHSDFLKMFKIESAVVKSFALQQETHSNRQSIQIQMLSDEPYEVKLKD